MAPPGKRLNRFRTVLLASLVALGLALPGLFLVQRSRSANRAAICARWTELSAAVAARDTEAERSLVVPTRRGPYDFRLRDFVSPLGTSPAILIFGDSATIWPNPDTLYQVIPIGRSFDMIRVDGVWYFTGEVHID